MARPDSTEKREPLSACEMVEEELLAGLLRLHCLLEFSFSLLPAAPACSSRTRATISSAAASLTPVVATLPLAGELSLVLELTLGEVWEVMWVVEGGELGGVVWVEEKVSGYLGDRLGGKVSVSNSSWAGSGSVWVADWA